MERAKINDSILESKKKKNSNANGSNQSNIYWMGDGVWRKNREMNKKNSTTTIN